MRKILPFLLFAVFSISVHAGECSSRDQCKEIVETKIDEMIIDHPEQKAIILKMKSNWNKFLYSLDEFESHLYRTPAVKEYEITPDTCDNDIYIYMSNTFLQGLDGIKTCYFD